MLRLYKGAASGQAGHPDPASRPALHPVVRFYRVTRRCPRPLCYPIVTRFCVETQVDRQSLRRNVSLILRNSEPHSARFSCKMA